MAVRDLADVSKAGVNGAEPGARHGNNTPVSGPRTLHAGPAQTSLPSLFPEEGDDDVTKEMANPLAHDRDDADTAVMSRDDINTQLAALNNIPLPDAYYTPPQPDHFTDETRAALGFKKSELHHLVHNFLAPFIDRDNESLVTPPLGHKISYEPRVSLNGQEVHLQPGGVSVEEQRQAAEDAAFVQAQMAKYTAAQERATAKKKLDFSERMLKEALQKQASAPALPPQLSLRSRFNQVANRAAQWLNKKAHEISTIAEGFAAKLRDHLTSLENNHNIDATRTITLEKEGAKSPHMPNANAARNIISPPAGVDDTPHSGTRPVGLFTSTSAPNRVTLNKGSDERVDESVFAVPQQQALLDTPRFNMELFLTNTYNDYQKTGEMSPKQQTAAIRSLYAEYLANGADPLTENEAQRINMLAGTDFDGGAVDAWFAKKPSYNAAFFEAADADVETTNALVAAAASEVAKERIPASHTPEKHRSRFSFAGMKELVGGMAVAAAALFYGHSLRSNLPSEHTVEEGRRVFAADTVPAPVHEVLYLRHPNGQTTVTYNAPDGTYKSPAEYAEKYGRSGRIEERIDLQETTAFGSQEEVLAHHDNIARSALNTSSSVKNNGSGAEHCTTIPHQPGKVTGQVWYDASTGGPFTEAASRSADRQSPDQPPVLTSPHQGVLEGPKQYPRPPQPITKHHSKRFQH